MARFSRSSTHRLLYTLCVSPPKSAASPSPAASLLAGTFHLRHFSAGNLARAKDDKEPWWKESMERLRNIGISAHIDSGKTTLTERILFYTGRIHEIHEVRGKDGVGAKMDSMDLEREKGITIQSASTYCSWKDYKINIIDTPGHVDFTIEVERALRVLDGAILVLCSVGGVQSQSITVDRQMRRYEVPRVAFINKLDRMGADPWKVLNQARSKLRHHSAAVQVPIGLEEDFKGLVDLVQLKAYYFHGSSGETVVAEDVSADMEAMVAEKRRELIEVVSEVDDNLAEAFLNDDPISSADLEAAIRRATVARKFIPVFMGSAFKNKGVQPLLDGVLQYLPCPVEVTNYALDQTKKEEKVVLSGTPDGPLVALAFKLEEGRFGQLTYLRIYEGVIRKGEFIININTGKKLKVPRLVRMHSDEMEDIQEAHAGQIVAVFGVDCASGDTFTDGSVKYTMTSMNVPEPVMSLAVQPISKDSGGQFSKALNRFQREDPTFRVGLDPESGPPVSSPFSEILLIIAAKIEADRKRKKASISAVDRTKKERYKKAAKMSSSNRQGGEVRASHILIKHQGSRRKASWKDPEGRVIQNTTRDTAVSQLKALRDDILSGKAKFEDVASRYSDCSSAKRGGDLGPFGRGQMQKPFEEATFGLKVGEISDIVDTDSGVHVIMRTG